MNPQVTPGPPEEASRILLVDDDATNLDVLRQTLTGPNYRLFVARTGEEALKVARRAKPSIILLDVVMPGIDGYETCRRLKDDPETRDAAVIFLSALSDPKEKVRGFEAGAVDFITKPVQAEEVIARVNTHLRIQRLLRRQVESASPAMPEGPHDDDATGLRVADVRKPGASVFRTGDVVAFRFRIVRYLAKGGMGELYEAEDLELRERIALKTILSHISDDERSILMFKREVQLARQVTHPNVCRTYDVFRHRYAASADRPANEVVLLSMELLHGETLADKLRREGRLSTQEILPVVRQMAAGLTAAHRVGIVHRDFKSHNVMLVKPTSADAEMRVVVTDFGLAWRSAHDESTSLSMSLSSGDEIVGTPAYMAPEQVEGGPVTPATDVYALGVVLYEMVTGTWPFVGETPLRMAIKRLEEPPPSPRVQVPDVDPLWEATILRCLARRPEDRFANASDVIFALEGALGEQSAGAADRTSAKTPTPAVRRSGGEAERRQLTVLVSGCEVFDSDAYLELDSEDQARVLQRFQERCEEAVRQFGGTVVQCSDKGLLACFGFPIAYEDAAGRAVRAGRAILDGMKRSEEQTDRRDTLKLHPWVGIHTGAAVVESKAGVVSLVGEVRNVAVRLEDVAVAGRIICTDASSRLFQGLFHCTSRGRQKIKGVAQPVDLFQIDHTAVAASPIDAVAAAALSRLTGRDQEIGLLMNRWEQAREGMGQVVLLIGEPGLGKSRLVHTMKQYVQGEMTEGEVDAPVIEWRCSPHFQNTELYPAVDFYERALAFDRDEPSQARVDRLLHRLEQHDLARPETVPLWASLLSLPTPDGYPPLSLSPVRQREETFRTMLDWLHARAARKPVLFIVEDLHWVDASTLEFLGQFLAEGLDDSILTLLTFRPEFKTPWPAGAHQTSLALTRLTRSQVGQMVRARTEAENLPNALVDSIYERTGGVPLFVEELTKMLHESGLLTQAGDDSSRARALLAREIPASLQDLLMARLDRMDGDRDVIQLAATLGREFSHELLVAASERDESTLLGEIDKLVQAEILRQKGRPPRCQYTFKHALLVDAAYNSLMKDKRYRFHRRIAEVLEARFPHIVDAQPELVAHHFTEAGLIQEGAAHWLKAGLRSQDRSAYREAIGQLTKALTLLETLEETEQRNDLELRVLSALGPAYIAVRGYAAPEAGPVLHRARELCERAGQPTHLFGILLGTWEWRLVRGDIRMCIDLAADGMALAERVNDPGMLMEALFMQGATKFYRAEFADARAYCEKAVALYDDRERTKFWAASTGHNAGVTHRCYLALALWHLGYADQAVEMDRETRELAATIAHAFSMAHAVDFAACLYHDCRVGAEVQRAAEEEIAIATEQGFELWQALGALHNGAAMLLQGRIDEALPRLIEGLQAFRDTGAGLRIPYYLSMLGDAYTQAGRFEDAHRVFDEAFETAEKNDDRFQQAELHRLVGELLLAESRDRDGQAEACFSRAIGLARLQGSRAWELRATMSLARLWQRQGRSEEASGALVAVFGSCTEGFATPDLVDASVLLESLTAERAAGSDAKLDTELI